MSSLTSTVIGLSRAQALQVLTHPLLSEPSANQVLEGMFDASDRPEEGGLILWLNDLEKDKEYERLPVNLENVSNINLCAETISLIFDPVAHETIEPNACHPKEHP